MASSAGRPTRAAAGCSSTSCSRTRASRVRTRRRRRSSSCTRITATSNLWEIRRRRDVVPALEALRARGLRMVVVSNANGTLLAHMERIRPDGARSIVHARLAGRGGRETGPALLRDRARSAAARARRRRSTSAICITWTSSAPRNAGLRGVLLDEANLRPDADCPRVRSLDELVGRSSAATSTDSRRTSRLAAACRRTRAPGSTELLVVFVIMWPWSRYRRYGSSQAAPQLSARLRCSIFAQVSFSVTVRLKTGARAR